MATEYIIKQNAVDLISRMEEDNDGSVSKEYYKGYCAAIRQATGALEVMPAEGVGAALAVDWMNSFASVAPTIARKVAEDLMMTLDQRDQAIRGQWELFADVPMNPETECIEQEFLGFPAGTHREDIWHWFDERYSKGVYALLYGEEDSNG